MKRLALILVASLALLPLHGARGQDAPIGPGTEVRVRTLDTGSHATSASRLDAHFDGRLERVSGDSLWVRVGSTDGPLVSIDRSAIHTLEIKSGQRRNAGKGALWGAGVGLGMGVLAAATLDDCGFGNGRFWFDLCDGDEDVLILGSIAAGTAWGTLIGFFIKTDRWVTLPPVGLTLGHDRGGFTLAVDFRLGF